MRIDVTWPWSGAVYARRIRLTISDWQDGPLVPLVVRFFPGHQETIAGTEGMIVTKRLITPWKSPDDQALIWLLECQAEGDRLLKLEIEIDWGEAAGPAHGRRAAGGAAQPRAGTRHLSAKQRRKHARLWQPLRPARRSPPR